MCLVSDKIKFCTCKGGAFTKLPHYWMLYRFSKNKDLMMLGTMSMPVDYLLPEYPANQQTFLKRLNEPDAFDKPIEFKAMDKMLIVINNLDGEDKRMTLSFEFKNGKWIEWVYDVFELKNRYRKKTFGYFEQLETNEQS